MTNENNQPAPQAERGITKTVLAWIISPGFFKVSSPNPFKIQASVVKDLQGGVAAAKERREKKRETDRLIAESAKKANVKAELAERLVFEAYVIEKKLSEEDLLLRHNGGIRLARRYFIFSLLLTALAAWLTFTPSPVSDLINILPWWVSFVFYLPLLLMYLSSIKYLFFAYSVRKRQHGSLALFLYWMTEPSLWFETSKLTAIPKATPIPDVMMSTLKMEIEKNA